VATARAMRALLRATNYCASEPEMTAEHLLDRDFAKNYEHALQTLRELPYGRWRDFDIEDTVRFYALRLREAGFVRSTPQKIIAQGTDWRFHHRLRSELKG
jgi:NitT/TauT family transport system substrate-binding protein